MIQNEGLSAVERVKARAVEILTGRDAAWKGTSLELIDRSAGGDAELAEPDAESAEVQHHDALSRFDEEVATLRPVEGEQSGDEGSGNEGSTEGAPSSLDGDGPQQSRGFQPYQEADLDMFPAEGLLGAAPDGLLHAMIVRVLQAESPAHFETILERLRVHWAMGRAREPTRVHVLRSIERLAAARPEIVCRRLDPGTDLFLSLSDARVVPRSPGIRGQRNVRHIADEEIQEGVFACAVREGAVSRDDLIRASREAFGYRRSGHEIFAAFDRAIDELLSGRRLIETWGQLRVPTV